MGNIKANQLARIGEIHLEEAVLEVLHEAKKERKLLKAATIGKRAGIFCAGSKNGAFKSALVCGVLSKLKEQGRIERHNLSRSHKPWEMTDKEFASRQFVSSD